MKKILSILLICCFFTLTLGLLTVNAADVTNDTLSSPDPIVTINAPGGDDDEIE